MAGEAQRRDPAQLEAFYYQLNSFYSQIRAAHAGYTRDDALNAANMSRFHLTATPELVASVTSAGISYDNHLLQDLVNREASEMWGPLRAVHTAAKATVRGGIVGLESLWDASVSKPLRTAVRMYQGEDFSTAYDNSGRTILGQIIGAKSSGQNVTLGSGWMPQPQDPLDQDDFRTALHAEFGRRTQMGDVDFGRAYTDVEAQFRSDGRLPVDPVKRAWDSADATRISKNGHSSGVSLGRLAAIQFVRPDTIPHTLLSGSIDTVTRVGMDPLNLPADYLTDFMRARRLIMPEALGKGTKARKEMAAQMRMYEDWRRWVHVKTPDEWADSWGRRVLEHLANNRSASETTRLLGNFPTEVQKQVTRARTTEQVLHQLRPHLGVAQPAPPTLGVVSRLPNRMREVLGARMAPTEARYAQQPTGTGPLEGIPVGPDVGVKYETVYPDESAFGRWLRRQSSMSSANATVLDPMDSRQVIQNIVAWGDTTGVKQRELDSLIELVLNKPHDYQTTQIVAARMKAMVENRLVELGENAEAVKHIMSQFSQYEVEHFAYGADLMGHEIDELHNASVVMKTASGAELPYRVPVAVQEAQFTARNIVIPSIRDVRIVTSRFRTTPDKWRAGIQKLLNYEGRLPAGINVDEARRFGTTWMRYKADQGMMLWRNAALLRIGWPLRVLPDEALRIMASGYAEMFTHPIHNIVASITNPDGITDLAGGSLKDWVRMQRGYGTGTLARGPGNVPLLEDALDVRRVTWEAMPTTDISGRTGLVKALVRLHTDDLARLVLKHGVDEAFDILTGTPGGQAILKRIAGEAGDLNKMRYIDRGNKNAHRLLRRTLESYEWQIAMTSGGHGYYRAVDNLGQPIYDHQGQIVWLDGFGNKAETYTGVKAGSDQVWNKQALIDELKARGQKHTRYKTNEARRARLMELDGTPPELMTIDKDRMYYTSDEGSARVRGFIENGHDIGKTEEYVPLVEKERLLIAGGRHVHGHGADGYVFHGMPSYQNTVSEFDVAHVVDLPWFPQIGDDASQHLPYTVEQLESLTAGVDEIVAADLARLDKASEKKLPELLAELRAKYQVPEVVDPDNLTGVSQRWVNAWMYTQNKLWDRQLHLRQVEDFLDQLRRGEYPESVNRPLATLQEGLVEPEAVALDLENLRDIRDDVWLSGDKGGMTPVYVDEIKDMSYEVADAIEEATGHRSVTAYRTEGRQFWESSNRGINVTDDGTIIDHVQPSMQPGDDAFEVIPPWAKEYLNFRTLGEIDTKILHLFRSQGIGHASIGSSLVGQAFNITGDWLDELGPRQQAAVTELVQEIELKANEFAEARRAKTEQLVEIEARKGMDSPEAEAMRDENFKLLHPTSISDVIGNELSSKYETMVSGLKEQMKTVELQKWNKAVRENYGLADAGEAYDAARIEANKAGLLGDTESATADLTAEIAGLRKDLQKYDTMRDTTSVEGFKGYFDLAIGEGIQKRLRGQAEEARKLATKRNLPTDIPLGEGHEIMEARRQGLDQGGLAHTLERARSYAGEEGRIFVYKVDELAPELQENLYLSSTQQKRPIEGVDYQDIEQFYGPGHDWTPRSEIIEDIENFGLEVYVFANDQEAMSFLARSQGEGRLGFMDSPGYYVDDPTVSNLTPDEMPPSARYISRLDDIEGPATEAPLLSEAQEARVAALRATGEKAPVEGVVTLLPEGVVEGSEQYEMLSELSRFMGHSGARGFFDGEIAWFNDVVVASETPMHVTSIRYEDVDTVIQRGHLFESDLPGNPKMLVEEQMGKRQWNRLADNVGELYSDEYQMPPRVLTPDPNQHPVSSFGEAAVNRFFWLLGGAPTQKLMRHQLFVTRLIEEHARFMIWTGAEGQAAVRAWAKKWGLNSRLNHYLRRQLKNHGLKELPKEAFIALNIDEIAEISKYRALEHVKELLYDLTKTNNFWDSQRLVFPFGDAWYEVLSRWAKLYNPWATVPGGYVQGGQALRNMRRPTQLAYSAEQGGFFDEDEFGNQVFKFPTLSPVTGFSGSRISPELDPMSLGFVTPEARSAAGPGMGPYMQFLAAATKPIIPPPLRNAVKWAVHGEFPEPDIKSIGGLSDTFLPSTLKSLVSLYFDSERREDQGNEVAQAFTAACESNNPEFDCSTADGAKRAEEHARKVAGSIGWIRVMNAMVLPGQPQYRGELDIYNDALGRDDEQLWINVGVLRAEMAAAREFFDGRENKEHLVMQYMEETFGVNVLNFTSSSMQIKPRPAEKTGVAFLQDHPELRDFADLTMMAFIPEREDDLFSSDGFQQQYAEGARVRLTEMGDYSQRRALDQANLEWSSVIDQYDEAVLEAKFQLAGTLPATLNARLAELKAWKDRREQDIATRFVVWDEGWTAVGRPGRPTYGNFLKEIREYVDPNTPEFSASANRYLTELNPEMMGFLTMVIELIDKAEERSLERGTTKDWWRTAEVNRPLRQSERNEPEEIRAWFQTTLDSYVRNRMSDPRNVNQARWVASRILTPLMAGFDYDTPMLLGEGLPALPSPGDRAGSDSLGPQSLPAPGGFNFEEMEAVGG